MTALTEPGSPVWDQSPPKFRRHQSTSVIGRGDELWQSATEALLRWEVKTRSGFDVPGAHPVVAGEQLEILVHLGPFRIREPIEVVEVVHTADRVGFAYRTRPGHPVDGEEAFVLSRVGDVVTITLRSLTRRSTTRAWALVFPVLRLAQLGVRRRYRRVLRG